MGREELRGWNQAVKILLVMLYGPVVFKLYFLEPKELEKFENHS